MPMSNNNNIDWERTTDDNYADFDSPSTDSEHWSDEPLSNPEPDNTEQVFDSKQSKPLGFKAVAIILAVALVIGVILLMTIDKLSVTKKKPVQQQTQQVTSQQIQTQGTTESISSSRNEEATTSSSKEVNGLVELPADTALSYNNELLSATGVVHDKVRYLSDNQVVYCIKIVLSFGGSKEIVSYYCGYNVFDSVDTGDMVTVQYQQVTNSCFSVNTISK